MSHTYTICEVSQRTFDEVAALLRAAGYDHSFHGDLIDMHGLALAAKADGATNPTELPE